MLTITLIVLYIQDRTLIWTQKGPTQSALAVYEFTQQEITEFNLILAMMVELWSKLGTYYPAETENEGHITHQFSML